MPEHRTVGSVVAQVVAETCKEPELIRAKKALVEAPLATQYDVFVVEVLLTIIDNALIIMRQNDTPVSKTGEENERYS